jgi:hypothetical protein
VKENLRGRKRKHMVTYPSWKSARAWLLRNMGANRVRRHVGPDRSMLLRYEDFVARPRRVLEDILAMVGVRGELPLADERTLAIGPQHSISGNPIRFTTGTVTLKEDDEWVTAQPPRDRRIVTAICLPLLRRYGYPVRPGVRSHTGSMA